MRVGISGGHGTGKMTLAEALCARLPGHVVADEPPPSRPAVIFDRTPLELVSDDPAPWRRARRTGRTGW